jgi:7-cyano-7-deazaguanine synthase in queuosine biosynthesis
MLRRLDGASWSRRQLELTVPVSDPERWKAVRDRLQGLLAFLSGDDWGLEFVGSRPAKELAADVPNKRAARAVLLSGGADSAIGALSSRSELHDQAHVLFSHFGPTFLPAIQRDVATTIGELLPGPDQLHVQIHFSRRTTRFDGSKFSNEYSTRARSLLFLSFGLAVASIHKAELWVPENGFASLNPPLGPDRRGSLSTRTTHPSFLSGVSAVLTEVGAYAELVNPFARATKGEMFARASDLVGRKAAEDLLCKTHSCAHTGHRTFHIPVRAQCGVCFGCSVRRAAFAASGLEDKTRYISDSDGGSQLERYLSSKSIEHAARAFLDRGIHGADVAAMSLPADYSAHDALDLCERQIKELRLVFP